MSDAANAGLIEIRIDKVSQLFDTKDLHPFHQWSLADEADAYITGYAQELPPRKPLTIVIHLPEAEYPHALGLGNAIASYYTKRADAGTRELRTLFRNGRVALLTGIAVFILCFSLAQLPTGWLGGGYVSQYFREGLVIVGWVANWRPMEIFLYDWWPIVSKRRLYRRLARAQVVLKRQS